VKPSHRPHAWIDATADSVLPGVPPFFQAERVVAGTGSCGKNASGHAVLKRVSAVPGVAPGQFGKDGYARPGSGGMVGLTSTPVISGGSMAHDWIIGLLSDLAAYARKNGLDLTAEASEEMAKVVRAEIANHCPEKDEHKTIPPRRQQH
jgi:hypothetical protein